MPFFDLPLEALRSYQPDVQEPDDFDASWNATMAEARANPLDVRLEPVDTALQLVEVFDVTFAGHGGDPVHAWLIRPAGTPGPLPGVVSFVGYGGGRGLPHERLAWAVAGFAELVVDTRGQGSSWGSGGHTADPAGSGPAVPGFLTRGIAAPEQHYYRRLLTDAALAVDALRAVPGVDSARVAVAGGSQGGGMALAAAGLVPDVAAVIADVPFLCHFARAVEVTGDDPYGEITAYLSVHRGDVEAVFSTLSYADAVNFAKRAVAPALFSVALMDTVCPPSTVFAAYNWYGARAAGRPVDKLIDVYPFNEHEGGGGHQQLRQLSWLSEVFASVDREPPPP